MKPRSLGVVIREPVGERVILVSQPVAFEGLVAMLLNVTITAESVVLRLNGTVLRSVADSGDLITFDTAQTSLTGCPSVEHVDADAVCATAMSLRAAWLSDPGRIPVSARRHPPGRTARRAERAVDHP